MDYNGGADPKKEVIMPGFILHLTAARFYLEYLSDSDPLKHSAQLQNDFYAGNLLPDARKDKAVSHFRDLNFRDRMLEWPKLQWFCQKYLEYMSDPVCRGYWLHLIVDKYFLRDYIPRVARFLDSEGKETQIRADVTWVEIQKSGERIPLELYLSEEYYYGDYTRMTTWLARTYALPDMLDPVGESVIEEADCCEVQEIMERLAKYKEAVPDDAVQELRVFDAEELVMFLRGGSKGGRKGKSFP